MGDTQSFGLSRFLSACLQFMKSVLIRFHLQTTVNLWASTSCCASWSLFLDLVLWGNTSMATTQFKQSAIRVTVDKSRSRTGINVVIVTVNSTNSLSITQVVGFSLPACMNRSWSINSGWPARLYWRGLRLFTNRWAYALNLWYDIYGIWYGPFASQRDAPCRFRYRS